MSFNKIEYDRIYRQTHAEKISIAAKAYRENHREYFRQKARIYYYAHRKLKTGKPYKLKNRIMNIIPPAVEIAKPVAVKPLPIPEFKPKTKPVEITKPVIQPPVFSADNVDEWYNNVKEYIKNGGSSSKLPEHLQELFFDMLKQRAEILKKEIFEENLEKERKRQSNKLTNLSIQQ